jgi:hypothetical protein
MKKIAIGALLAFSLVTAGFAGEGRVRRMPEPIGNEYLVMLQGIGGLEVPRAAASLNHRFGGHTIVLYQNGSTGFAARMTDAQATALSHDPMVRFVEEAALLHFSSDQTLPSDDSLYFLDRLDGSQDRHYDYCEKGADVIAYVIGTGTWVDHAEFQTNGSSRVLQGTSFASDVLTKPGDSADYGYYPYSSSSSPCISHDTATASVLAGNTYGVAKHASIVPIRIGACGGATSSVYLNYAVDWIMGSSNPHRSHRPAVVSISVYQFVTALCYNSGNKVSPLQASYLENEVDALMGYDWNGSAFVTPHVVHESGQSDYNWDGIPVVVSANNQDSNTGDTTPARMAWSNAANFGSGAHVISVGGLDENDARWTNDTAQAQEPTACSASVNAGSNYGPTVDIYAAAHHIKIAVLGSTTSTTTSSTTLSGTSFSAPIVAGLIARIQEVSGALSPAAAWTALQSSSLLPSSAIEPGGNNNKQIARLSGQASCSTEYP